MTHNFKKIPTHFLEGGVMIFEMISPDERLVGQVSTSVSNTENLRCIIGVDNDHEMHFLILLSIVSDCHYIFVPKVNNSSRPSNCRLFEPTLTPKHVFESSMVFHLNFPKRKNRGVMIVE